MPGRQVCEAVDRILAGEGASIRQRRPGHNVPQVVGITGAPGTGKSSLVDAILGRIAEQRVSERVAVLLVDPSSERTGGALLGDRVRLSETALGTGVFVRSIATRGQLGGLSATVANVIRLLEAVGFLRIFVETVGVGQVEIDVATATDTTVVVLNPGAGDAVQAAKAGLMEIADLFVVNKADLDGAADVEREVLSQLEHSAHASRPIVRTSTVSGVGISELLSAITLHHEAECGSGRSLDRRIHRRRQQLIDAVRIEQSNQLDALVGSPAFEQTISELTSGGLGFYDAIQVLVARLRLSR
jgi:LAO/AO transport system kinase